MLIRVAAPLLVTLSFLAFKEAVAITSSNDEEISLSQRGVPSITHIQTTVLGIDPPTVNRLNGESFQQDALATFNGFQYAVFYGSTPFADPTTPRHVSVARRSLGGSTATTSTEPSTAATASSSPWEILTLTDYKQTDDDGHDVITLGISPRDGRVHIAFDQHDNDLHYRISEPGVVTNPSATRWTEDIFGTIQDVLPGLEMLNRSEHFENVTYPRFLTLSSGSLLLEMRVGRSGLGDDWLYEYSGEDGKWREIGKYLEGVQNNAYINGLDVDSAGTLQVSWTYRDFINDTGQDVAVQAGPNGPENNHDMDFAYSTDLGTTWRNNWGQRIGDLSSASGEPILPNSAGITIFSIPKFGGILNQEAQTVDDQDRIHVLNRENTTGVEQWYHYWRSTTHDWTRTVLLAPNMAATPTATGKRGKVVAYKSNIIMVLPDNAANSTALTLLVSTAKGNFRDWTTVWQTEGNGWEPVFDRYRLAAEGVLSLLVVNGTRVEVVDLDLSGLG